MKNMTDMILSKIALVHGQWVEHYTQVIPEIVKSRILHFSRKRIMMQSFMLRCVMLILNGLPLKAAPKFVFEGLRHRALMETLPKQDVMVLGGRNEWIYCLKNGYRFYWIGYVTHAFELYIWGGNKQILAKAVCCIQTLFSLNKDKKKYLFLWEDSLPIGLTLSVVFEKNPDMAVICIAHGFYPHYKKQAVLPEGVNCQFNLVWDPSQKNMFPSGLQPKTYVLGLPLDISFPPILRREVVLVGHCGLVSGASAYFWSLYHFSKIFGILTQAGWDVSFRPHPEDDIAFVRKIFPVICTENKLELFCNRKVYIGVISSLLYEARQFGNIVFGLDTSTEIYERAFDVDRIVLEKDYDKLPYYLTSAFEEVGIKSDIKLESLAVRLNRCLIEIDAFCETV